ncbi:DNA repair protein [Viridothelium virens]|uniref:DNA repair protein REV1 n=1 Tax=Viridothelium virens TaxID=1048519 RepID=A0A6A6HDS5_VIRVR|nr:DNA repair protein [Viridothelium virens]
MGSRLENNSNATRKRIEEHGFENEEGEEYEPSKFGGFPDYFRRKKIKLQNLDAELRAQSSENPLIFRGIVAHVNGYTQPSLNDLHKLIVSHGGGFIQYLDGKTQVTHIIASNLTPKKIEEFRRFRIVKPAWVVDSVNAGRLLPWNTYSVVDEGAGQKVLQFDSGRMVSQRNLQFRGYRDQSDTSWYNARLDGQILKENKLDDGESMDYDGQGDEATVSVAEKNSLDQQTSSPFLEEGSPFLTSANPSNSVNQLNQKASDTLDSSSLYDVSQANGLALSKGIIETSKEQKTPRRSSRTLEQNVLDQDDNLQYFIRPASPEGRDKNSPKLKPNIKSDTGSPSRRAGLTAEEHNAILLADPRIRKSTVVNPDFLEQYYRESRLHHLSTWKANLKSQLQKMASEKTSSQKTRAKRLAGSRRYILHVDFDSFFVAVSLKKCPQFRDKPAVVAHGGGSGSEIASCNYPARKFGVKNGMWMKRAQDLCPDLKILPYDFPAYEEASRIFYGAIINTGGIVQSVSIDEALVDVSTECIIAGGSDGKQPREGSIYREQTKAEEIAQNVRNRVLEEAGCAVSVGIGGNILLAKVALRKAKPAGQCQIKPEDVLDFIGKLEVQDLPGVAYSIGGKLEDIGVRYVSDIRELTKEKLITTLGPKTGEKVWDYSRGIDKTEVGDQVIRKSVSAEVNWGVRFETQEQADEFIESLCGELHKRLMAESVKGRQFTMKIMRRAPDAPLDPPKHLGHGKCDTFNKSIALGTATNDPRILTKEALSILRSYGFSPGELRGIGVQMTRLEPCKGTVNGTFESSQKLLQFKTKDSSIASAAKSVDDPIQDDIRTPKKPKEKSNEVEQWNVPDGLRDSDSPSRKPLNVAGTQFIMPTAVDPEVLAELPEDIRSKLIKHATPGHGQISENNVLPNKSEVLANFLPTESQLDPETLKALPATVRAEISAFYENKNRASFEHSLPLSPSKPRPQPHAKKQLTRKRGGGLSRGRGASKVGSSSTLTQAAFVITRPRTESPEAADEISEDFLAALPEDIRREVLEEQRRERLKRTSGIDIGTRARRPVIQDQNSAIVPGRERTIKLAPRPATPTFTMKKFSHLPELRDAISAWVKEFREEGPYEEDVEALNKYLRAVVVDEGDMNKAMSVVGWLQWVIEAEGDQQGKMAGEWKNALETIKEAVQIAVETRGLGKVQF